ncbi:flagellar filament capping protein FliD [Virgibacillus sp. 179-BFC.A HS]|uniref:Filament cap protein n=1 Tax=Tigheibacillus jepli TaxID=3035914 RepID=A0ABU5CFI3_9BACI|nr:flagellar filament capping protein FliD [Virgibacillus sp. 179-BFC.A HS]MDY0405094.1 flagellar filament capping protein FliD [Virgibacillus sp. 179-BFC.A HS]
MRIGGLATGMDIDELVNKLMTAERAPLHKMEQDKTKLTWQRDAFRDVNKVLKELDDMMLNMKLSKTYNTKKISSSQEGAVTATGAAGTANGSYTIEVKQLATAEMKVGKLSDKGFEDALGKAYNFTITTYDEKGEPQVHEIQVNENESLKDVINKVNNEVKDIRMFYDQQSGQVVMETTYTGIRNPDKDQGEIVLGGNFFSDVVKLDSKKEAQNAEFTYNGNLALTSKDNSYTLNGITYEFKGVTDGPATLTVTNDVDAAFDNIKAFVDKYNEVVEKLNGTQTEERYRNFLPLTDEQKRKCPIRKSSYGKKKQRAASLKVKQSLPTDCLRCVKAGMLR